MTLWTLLDLFSGSKHFTCTQILFVESFEKSSVCFLTFSMCPKSWFGCILMNFDANHDLHHVRKGRPKIEFISKLYTNNIWVHVKCFEPLNKSRGAFSTPHSTHERRVLGCFQHFEYMYMCKSWFSPSPKSSTKNQTFFNTLYEQYLSTGEGLRAAKQVYKCL